MVNDTHFSTTALLLILALVLSFTCCCDGAINFIKRYRDVCTVFQDGKGRSLEFFRHKTPIEDRRDDTLPSHYAFAFKVSDFLNETGYIGVALVEQSSSVAVNSTFYLLPFGLQSLPVLSFVADGAINESIPLRFHNVTIRSYEQLYLTKFDSLHFFTMQRLKKNTKLLVFGNYDRKVTVDDLYRDGELQSPQFVYTYDIIGGPSSQSCIGSSGIFLKYWLYPQQFKRVTVYVSLSIDLLVIGFTLLCVILLRKRKLIAARFITPYLSLALLTVFRVLMSFDYPLVDETIYYISLSIIAVYCISSGMVFYSLESMRYFYIRNVYTIIAKMEDKNITAAESSSQLSIHRKLISKPAVLAMLSFIMITLLFPVFLYHIPLWVDVGSPIATGTLDGIQNTSFALICFMPAVVCSIGALSFIVEFFINLPLIRKRGLSWYISFDDPLLVRSEVFIFSAVGLPLLASAGGVFFSMLLGEIPLPRCTGPRCITAKALTNLLTQGLILSPTTWILCFSMGGGFACLVELFRIGKCVGADVTMDGLGNFGEDLNELKNVLENSETYELFEQYCTRELSIENLKLWNRLATQTKMNSSMDLDEFRKLYQQFIAQSSPLQVNISSETQKKLQNLLANTGKIAYADLKPLVLDVMHNLNDTYHRFRNTTEFNRYKARINLKESLMKDNYKIATTDSSSETNQTPTTPTSSTTGATSPRFSVKIGQQ